MKWLLLFLSISANASTTTEAKIHLQIEQWRIQAKNEGWTFEVAYHPILRLSEEARTGLKIPSNWQELAPFVSPRFLKSLPVRWDWKEQGMVTEVKDQAYPVYCGSCWAFGSVAIVESAIKIATGRHLDISEQQLVSCKPSYGTCGGGYYAMGFYLVKGANYESDFPYLAKNVPCRTEALQNEKMTHWAYLGSRGRGPTVEEIKQAIYQYGPVAATVSASGAWGAYHSGIYNACNSNRTNHIVAIVGWDDEGGYWIVKNSHGIQWGEQGYIRMKYLGNNGQKCNRIGETAAFVVYKP